MRPDPIQPSRCLQMASFVERTRCPGCGSGATATLLSRDFAHPTVWRFLEHRYRGRLPRRVLAGRPYELARCARCSLLFQRRVLTDPGLAALYDTGKERAGTQDEPPALSLPGAGSRVLDLGADDGRFVRAARAAGATAVAIEIAPSKLARLRAEGLEAHDRVEDVEHRDLALVRCFDVLEHLPRPLETLQALAGRLAPGGRLELRVVNAARCPTASPGPFWTARDDALRPLEHVNGFTPRALRLMAQVAGLTCAAAPSRPWRRAPAVLHWQLLRADERELAA